MSRLFGRAWKVTVDSLDVSHLDVEFKILSSIKSNPNKCVLTLWQVNEDHRAQLLKRNHPAGPGGAIQGVPVQVEAGYVNDTSVLFSGDLREVSSQRDNVDWKTTLSGDDGGRAYREGHIETTFTAGTPVSTVLQQCAQALGVGLGNLSNFAAEAQIAGIGSTLPHTMTLSGPAQKQLDRVMRSIGLTWSVQRGVLQVLQRGTPLNQTAILVSTDTGLVGSPEASIDATLSLGNPQQFAPGAAGAKKSAPKPKDPSVLKIKTLLVPGMVPGRKIDLRSAAFSGGYVLTECEYVGQSWAAGEWHINSVARVY